MAISLRRKIAFGSEKNRSIPAWKMFADKKSHAPRFDWAE
jgi:hypothetical protein